MHSLKIQRGYSTKNQTKEIEGTGRGKEIEKSIGMSGWGSEEGRRSERQGSSMRGGKTATAGVLTNKARDSEARGEEA